MFRALSHFYNDFTAILVKVRMDFHQNWDYYNGVSTYIFFLKVRIFFMLIVTSCPLELRGIAHKRTKEDKIYYIINCESVDGTPHALYCPDASAFPTDLHKGDMVYVTFNVHRYNGNERLVVSSVSKASDQ